MNVYLTDRSCFYGNYNLDADAAFIVQNVQNYPYKYTGSSLAIEQIIASRDSGPIGTYLAFLDSPFLASLLVNPEAQDSKLGRLPMTVSDFAEVQFKTVTSDGGRETLFERVLASVQSERQPADLFVEERLAVNLGKAGSAGFGDLAGGSGGSGSGSVSGAGTGEDSGNDSNRVEASALLIVVLTALFSVLI